MPMSNYRAIKKIVDFLEAFGYGPNPVGQTLKIVVQKLLQNN